MRRQWYLLTGVIIFFIIGYLRLCHLFRKSRLITFLDLIVPGIFFFSINLVWLTTTLSLQDCQ